MSNFVVHEKATNVSNLKCGWRGWVKSGKLIAFKVKAPPKIYFNKIVSLHQYAVLCKLF